MRLRSGIAFDSRNADKQDVAEDQLTIHSDRGPSMTSHSVAQLLATLGVTKSHSRPHVSNDNPFSESQFKTLKYGPTFPDRFDGYDDALQLLPEVFPLVQRRALPLGHRPDDAGHAALRPSAEVVAVTPASPAGGLRKPPGTFRARPSTPPKLPDGSLDQPARSRRRREAQNKRLPEPQCPQKPDASLTHPRPGYPSSSCVPAELDSVSPDNQHDNSATRTQQPLNTRAMPQKIRGLGAGPRIRQHASEAKSFFTNFQR